MITTLQSVNRAGYSYNAGNWIAILASAIQSYMNSGNISSGLIFSFLTALLGSSSAVETFVASVAFILAGTNYTKTNVLWGHLWSILGAVLLTFGMVGISNSALAVAISVFGGVLHAGGKFGSIVDPSRNHIYKLLPLISRAPMTVSLALDLLSVFRSRTFTSHEPVPWLALLLLASQVMWARADVFLMPGGGVRNALGRMLGVPSVGPCTSQ